MKVCKDLIDLFGNKFTFQAVCMELNTEYEHLVGFVMRKSKVSGRRGTISDSYDVAWEFSALGESSLPSVVLVNASIAGSRVIQIWLFRSGIQELLDDFVSVDKSIAVSTQKGWPKGPKNSYLEKIHESLEVLSDVDSYGVAPESDSDSEVEVTTNSEVAAALSEDEDSSAPDMDV
jgi:hypothetical protein